MPAVAALTALATGAIAPAAEAAQATPVSLSAVGENEFIVPAGVTGVNVALIGAESPCRSEST